MFEREYRDLRFVNRWQIVRRLKDQNLAEHQYFVALYARQVAHVIGWKGDIGALLTAALVHDIGELISGDLPGPFKRLFSGQMWGDVEAEIDGILHERGLWRPHRNDDDVDLILKVADLIDEAGWLHDEINLGNTSLVNVLSNTMQRLHEAVNALTVIKGVDRLIVLQLHNQIVDQLCRKSSTVVRG